MIFFKRLERERARIALRRRGICPTHQRPFVESRAYAEKPGWYARLCEDCIPEYEEAERKRLEYLMKAAR